MAHGITASGRIDAAAALVKRTKRRVMETIRSRDGTVIAFDKAGDGPPVILVSGALGYRAFPKLQELAALLARDFTVVNYDRRGRGDSTDTPPYAVEREVEDLDALIDAVGGPACLWGWSSGCGLALHAAMGGLAMRKLALYEPPYMVGEHSHRAHAGHRERFTELAAAGRRSDAVKYFMRMVGVPGVFVAAMRLLPMWARLKAVAHTLPYDAAVMDDYALPAERLASVRTPTLVFGGAKSPPELRAAVHAVAEALPNAEERFLDQQSHNPSMPALAPVIKEFFAA